jgi:hypothetical protein
VEGVGVEGGREGGGERRWGQERGERWWWRWREGTVGRKQEEGDSGG